MNSSNNREEQKLAKMFLLSKRNFEQSVGSIGSCGRQSEFLAIYNKKTNEPLVECEKHVINKDLTNKGQN